MVLKVSQHLRYIVDFNIGFAAVIKIARRCDEILRRKQMKFRRSNAAEARMPVKFPHPSQMFFHHSNFIVYVTLMLSHIVNNGFDFSGRR
jgi:hypothetical protein